MAVAGIIAEYNPFHRGHAWQLRQLRQELGEDTAVVAVMSGNFVQRGDLAILGKHERAEAALLGGVDLVLELPTPWSAAPAEQFAWGGVSLLAATGAVTHLVFGSEGGALAPLERAAACLDSEAYHQHLRRLLAEGMTFAAARERAAAELLGGDAACLGQPNSNLAVEYLRALNALGRPMEPMTFPRVGAAHDSGERSELASASAIRAAILAGEAWESLVPESTAAILRREMAAGRAPVSLESCQRAVLARLRCMEEGEFLSYDGGGEGLYHRFYDAVHQGRTVEELLTLAKTKRYPLARLRRLLLHSYLGILPARRGEVPPYLRVLGANSRGREVLGRMRNSAALPVITRPAQARRLGGAAEKLLEQETRCTDLYTLACPELAQSVPDSEYGRSPVML